MRQFLQVVPPPGLVGTALHEHFVGSVLIPEYVGTLQAHIHDAADRTRHRATVDGHLHIWRLINSCASRRSSALSSAFCT
jgi:hypothetical protein